MSAALETNLAGGRAVWTDIEKPRRRLWAMFDFVCGKRLASAVGINLVVSEKCDELQGLRRRLPNICARSAQPLSTACWPLSASTRSCSGNDRNSGDEMEGEVEGTRKRFSSSLSLLPPRSGHRHS